MLKRLLAGCLAALIAATPAYALTEQQRVVLMAPSVVTGTPTALTITSSLFTGGSPPTDLTPVSQFVNGWTATLALRNVTPAGSTGSYNFGSWPATPNLSFPVVRHGYDASANPTTFTETDYATSWLRQPYSNQTLPTEGGTANLAVTLWNPVYASDTVNKATAVAGLYTGSKASTRIPITNSSTLTYPIPIGTWITEPGIRYDGSSSATVEFFGGQALAMGGTPLAAVNITLSDGTHSTSHLATLGLSARLLSTTCTATLNSNVLTGCGSTAGFIVGERLTVPGVPGQPKIASIDSATQMTLGSTGTVTTTLNSATISVTNNTVPAGDGLGDGLFVGATLNCGAPLNGGSDATISVEPTTAGLTQSGGKTTAAPWTTSTSTSTAATNTACTFKHVYQGVTGTVRVTLGDPQPTWQATFSAGEIAAMTDGAVWFRAQGYASVGDVVLDTQTGADGTGIDWNGQAFLTNGSDISPNLHNLFAYKDAAGNYAPRYAWVGSSAGASPAVQTTSADPGSAAYYGTIGAACAGLKTYYNANKGHNNANGGMIILKGSVTYTGVGTSMAACTALAAPLLTITYDPAAAALSPTIANGATVAIGPMTKLLGVTYTVSSTGLTGVDTAVTSTKLGTSVIFDQSKLTSSAASIAGLWKIGALYLYNNLIDQSAGDGSLLKPFSTASSSVALAAGNTIINGTYTARIATAWVYNYVGNITWGGGFVSPIGPADSSGSANYIRPLSMVYAYNKLMGGQPQALLLNSNYPINNVLLANNVYEVINNSGLQVAVQVSADNNNNPASNVFRHYETVAGNRTNIQYLEGLNGGTPFSTGGTLANATYYVQVVYSLIGAPGVETATDIPSAGIAVPGTGAGSITLLLPYDPLHVATVYISDAGGVTPNHIATATVGGVAGTAASQIATFQNITITALGASQTPTAGLPGHNELKTAFTQRFVIDNNFNMKGDVYNGSGSTANGARNGNWAGRWMVSNMGMVAVTGSVINNGAPGPASGLGEITSPYGFYGPDDLTSVKYKSDRSFGKDVAAPVTPALNIGQGNYCIDTSSVTTPLNRVPAGYAAWPTDIQGRGRPNDGTGAAGAYAQGCL